MLCYLVDETAVCRSMSRIDAWTVQGTRLANIVLSSMVKCFAKHIPNRKSSAASTGLSDAYSD